jgi:putative protease
VGIGERQARAPELLAPAGDVERLKVALRFGADAVYLGLQRLSLRGFATNFGWDELEWALGYARGLGRRVYVAVNVQPFDDDLPEIEATLRRLEALRPDAVIVADPGVLDLARSVAPSVGVHLSTQLSVSNAAAARSWLRAGARRICVARELTLERLAAVVAGAGGPIEAFVHGAVCVAWSGRCFTSLYWAGAGRDPRRGECAQACRWKFRSIEDRRRPGEANPVEADERGTYFFDAKDLCSLPLLDRLVATGVQSLKIEGRTRSEHYVGAVVDVYRDALDRLAAGDLDGFRARQELWLAELRRPTGRGFSTHFYGGGVPGPEAYNPGGSRKERANSFVGPVLGRADDHLLVELRNPLRPLDRIEVRSPGLRSEKAVVQEVRDADGALLDFGRSPQTVRLMGRFDAEVGALVRLAD